MSSTSGSEATVAQKLARYDELSRLILEYQSVPEMLRKAEYDAIEVERELKTARVNLKKNRDRQPYQERRLHRNAHPHFLHYLQFNREAKVKRLEGELEAARREESELEATERRLSSSLARLKEETVPTLRSRNLALASFKEEQRAIFDNVVDGRPPTDRLLAISMEKNECDQELSVDGDLLKAVRFLLLFLVLWE